MNEPYIIEENPVYLQFDFQDQITTEKFCFERPIETITAYDINDVIPCLNKIEQAHQNGKYVAGYIHFEAAYAFFNVQKKLQSKQQQPIIWFGVFDQPIDKHARQRSTYSVTNWKAAISKKAYLEDVDTILAEINKKTFSQINYTTKWEATFHGDIYAYYDQLKRAQKANYCAYLNIGKIIFFHYHLNYFFRPWAVKLLFAQ